MILFVKHFFNFFEKFLRGYTHPTKKQPALSSQPLPSYQWCLPLSLFCIYYNIPTAKCNRQNAQNRSRAFMHIAQQTCVRRSVPLMGHRTPVRVAPQLSQKMDRTYVPGMRRTRAVTAPQKRAPTTFVVTAPKTSSEASKQEVYPLQRISKRGLLFYPQALGLLSFQVL